MEVTPAKVLRFVTRPGYARMVVATNAARWRAGWRRRRGYAPPPPGLTVFLTDRCNLRCRFCSQWGEKGVCRDSPPQVMERAVFEALLEQVAGWKPFIHLIGGEPFLYPHLIWALERIRAYGMGSFVITNGTLLQRSAREVVEAGLSVLCISVDGPREVHDRIRGRGTYDKILAGIDVVQRAKQELGCPTPEIHIAATISKDSYATLPELAEQLRPLPVKRLIVQQLSFMTEDQMRRQNELAGQWFGIHSENIEGLAQDPGHFDLARLKGVIQTLSETRYPFEVGFGPPHPLSDIDAYYGDPEGYERRQPERCGHIWRMASLYVDGQVTPCMNFGAGRITERPFLDIWNSPRFRRFRRIIERKGYLPACHRCCNE